MIVRGFADRLHERCALESKRLSGIDLQGPGRHALHCRALLHTPREIAQQIFVVRNTQRAAVFPDNAA